MQASELLAALEGVNPDAEVTFNGDSGPLTYAGATVEPSQVAITLTGGAAKASGSAAKSSS